MPAEQAGRGHRRRDRLVRRLRRCVRHPEPGFADSESALAWLESERPNLIATIRSTARQGPYELAWLLADALRGHLYHRMQIVDLREVVDAALAAADGYGDPAARAAARLGLGQVHITRHEYQAAIDACREAGDLARQAGWDQGASGALGNLGSFHGVTGRLDDAVEYYQQGLSIDRRIGWLAGQMAKLHNLGLTYHKMGRLQDAAEALTEALGLYRKIQSTGAETLILDSLGRVYHALGRASEAQDLLDRALAAQRDAGDRSAQGYTHGALARLYRDAGRLDEARQHAGAAAHLADAIEDQVLASDVRLLQASLYLHSGRYGQAVDGYRQMLARCREQGLRSEEVEAMCGLAAAQLGTGQLDRAVAHAQAARTTARQRQLRTLEGESLTISAAAELRRDHPELALDLARAALATQRETGDALGSARAQLVVEVALHRLGRAWPADPHLDRAPRSFADLGAPVNTHTRLLLGESPPAANPTDASQATGD